MLNVLKNFDLKYLIIFAFALRLLLSTLPPFEIDQIGWRAWSMRMVEVGPANFYSEEVFTDNPPGFLYVFWLIGSVKNTLFQMAPTNFEFDLLLKLPTNLSDIASGFIIYLLIKRKLSENLAKFGFILYVFNPAILLNTSIWGQFDGSAVLFMLLATYFLVAKKVPELAAISFTIAWAIKPQALAFAPVFGLLMLLTNRKFTRLLTTGLSFLLSTLVIYFPFFPKNPLEGFLYVNKAMTGIFTCTTCYAFNFWGMFGNWKDDQLQFLGITYLTWGLILLSLSFIPIFFMKPFLKRFKEPYFYLTASVSIFSFFIFLTRMHERYLFPFFAFFTLAVIFFRSTRLLVIYGFLSFLYFINQYLAYGYYNWILPNKLTEFNPPLVNSILENFNYFAIVTFIYFIFLVIYYIYLLKHREPYEL